MQLWIQSWGDSVSAQGLQHEEYWILELLSWTVEQELHSTLRKFVYIICHIPFCKLKKIKFPKMMEYGRLDENCMPSELLSVCDNK